MADRPQLTTGAGKPIADNQNSITPGPMGPVVLHTEEGNWDLVGDNSQKP